MKVISKVKDKCEKEFIDWFKDLFNIIGEEEIESVIIYTKSGKIFEVSFEDSE